MAIIYRRPKADGSFTYWTKFRRDGKLIRTNTNTDNRAKAQRFLREQIGNIKQGVDPRVDVRKVTYQQIRDNLVKHYDTYGKRDAKEYMKRLRHLDAFFARHRAVAITEDEVTRYVRHRQGQDTRPTPEGEIPGVHASINRELAVLKKMLRRACQGRLLVHVPAIEMLDERPPRRGFVEQDTFEMIRKNLPGDLQVVAVLGYTYGMRLQEVLGLEWEKNIDWAARQIVLHAGETKNDEPRTLPFTDEVEVLLREQRAYVRAHVDKLPGKQFPAYVFPLLPGDYVRPKYLGSRRLSLRRAWLAATKAAGVEGLLFHDLRRSAVRNLVRAGVAPQVAQTVSGHKSADVF